MLETYVILLTQGHPNRFTKNFFEKQKKDNGRPRVTKDLEAKLSEHSWAVGGRLKVRPSEKEEEEGEARQGPLPCVS